LLKVYKNNLVLLFCDKHFEAEFLRAERWVQYIGIPLFTILTILYLSSFPFALDKEHLTFHVLFSFTGIVAIWFSIRRIVFIFRKHLGKLNTSLRLSLQLILSSAIAVFITWFLQKPAEMFVANLTGFCKQDFDFQPKNLYLTVILFAFLLNTIYESFYLFLRLSENALETERYKNESVEAQYQNLTSRLNPHFLFNSLNTLTTVVEEDPKKAVKYIQELSVVYRYVLNSQKAAWSDLTAEIKFTTSYISLLKMRFEDNLKISLDLCESHLNYHILPMTIQLLIENAVKHNEISSSHPLEIKIYCEEEKLIVSNKKQKRNIMPSTTKVGLHNISERYRFLVDKEVIIEDKKDSFTVKIPLVKTLSSDIEHITDEAYQ
jgi:two-component system LytT family sensor kinase